MTYPASLDADILRLEGSGDRAVSPKGAIGRNQIMPGTAQRYLLPGETATDLFNPAVNDRIGKAIRRDLWEKYGDETAVKIAYNAGEGAADRWLAAGKDPSVLPAETQRYIGALGYSAGTRGWGGLGGLGLHLSSHLGADFGNYADAMRELSSPSSAFSKAPASKHQGPLKAPAVQSEATQEMPMPAPHLRTPRISTPRTARTGSTAPNLAAAYRQALASILARKA